MLNNDGPTGRPFLITRTDTAGWIDNSAINNTAAGGAVGEKNGPGTITPPVVIALTSAGPFLENVDPGFLPGQADAQLVFGGWAAFDGTTNAPYVFPDGASIRALEQSIFTLGL
jgi:hypothetical protein